MESMPMESMPMWKVNKLKYIREYTKEKYDRLNLTAPAGAREYYKEEAARLGMSLSNFFLVAADEYLERH